MCFVLCEFFSARKSAEDVGHDYSWLKPAAISWARNVVGDIKNGATAGANYRVREFPGDCSGIQSEQNSKEFFVMRELEVSGDYQTKATWDCSVQCPISSSGCGECWGADQEPWQHRDHLR